VYPYNFATNADCSGRDEVEVNGMVSAIELSAAPNFLEEARQCLHLAGAEPEGELRTILEGMARGWLKMADCAWVSQGPDRLSNCLRKIMLFDTSVEAAQYHSVFSKAVSSARSEEWCGKQSPTVTAGITANVVATI
jgi:hypothetical protein